MYIVPYSAVLYTKQSFSFYTSKAYTVFFHTLTYYGYCTFIILWQFCNAIQSTLSIHISLCTKEPYIFLFWPYLWQCWHKGPPSLSWQKQKRFNRIHLQPYINPPSRHATESFCSSPSPCSVGWFSLNVYLFVIFFPPQNELGYYPYVSAAMDMPGKHKIYSYLP